ncbi:MAG: hypothetical protein Q7S57_04285 [bacterium]|nr:hypothetical protein [bacterium]
MMNDLQAKETNSNQQLVSLIGVFVLLASLVVLAVILITVGMKSELGKKVVTDATIYVDLSGRITVDKVLQMNGPNAVPVTAGTHELVFLDRTDLKPVTLTVKSGGFVYVPDNQGKTYNYSYNYNPGTTGLVQVAVFPPDAKISIPDCTPVGSKYPLVCDAQHTQNVKLSPGNYVVRFTHPLFTAVEKPITVARDGVVRVSHSFISTNTEWENWRNNNADVLIRFGYGRANYSRGEDVFLLPFKAVGSVLRELFR